MPMTIRINNFGPVKSGRVELKPLTILIGGNNMGKSYVAMLVHSLLSSRTRHSAARGFRLYNNDVHARLLDDYSERLEQLFRRNEERDSFDVPQELTEEIFCQMCDMIGREIRLALERNFGAGITDLIKRGAPSAQLDVAGPQDLAIRIGPDLQLKPSSAFAIRYRFAMTSIRKQVGADGIEMRNDGDTTTITVYRPRLGYPLNYKAFEYLLQSVANRTGLAAEASYYLPASRSGILQGQIPLLAGVLRSSDPAAIGTANMPRLTGAAYDFMSDMLLALDHKSEFSAMAERMEKDMLGGITVLRRHDEHISPYVTYVADDGEFPLHRASSSISEIAPLSLYMKHIIQRGSLLIIEEPESHLHPENQLVMARYIVRMIRAGIRVFLTTHSEFLLEKLGKFILASNINPEARGEILKADAGDYLCPEEVSAHRFSTEDDGIHVRQLDPDADLGISQEEFTRISRSLYDESIRIEERTDEA